MKKQPDDADMYKIFKGYHHKYCLIGTGLGVNVSDFLMYPNMTTNNFILVCSRWRAANREVTWGKVDEVCATFNDELGQVRAILQNFLSSEEAHCKYFERPDHN